MRERNKSFSPPSPPSLPLSRLLFLSYFRTQNSKKSIARRSSAELDETASSQLLKIQCRSAEALSADKHKRRPPRTALPTLAHLISSLKHNTQLLIALLKSIQAEQHSEQQPFNTNPSSFQRSQPPLVTLIQVRLLFKHRIQPQRFVATSRDSLLSFE